MPQKSRVLCKWRQWALAEAAAERMRGLPQEMPAAYPPGDAGREWRELLTTRAWQVRVLPAPGASARVCWPQPPLIFLEKCQRHLAQAAHHARPGCVWAT